MDSEDINDKKLFHLFYIIAAAAVCSCECAVPEFPGGEGLGVSGHFAGMSAGRLIVAGGCNFPDTPASEGGVKVFYPQIWACRLPGGGGWEEVGTLPSPTAYGAAVNIGDDIICLGGSGGPQVTVLRWDCGGDTLSVRSLDPLPFRADNFAACTDTDREEIYIAGGNMDGTPSTKFFRGKYCGDRISWERLPDFPGPARVQPVMACAGGRIYLAGGFENGESPVLPAEVLSFGTESGVWEAETTVPDSLHTFSGGCCASYGDYLLFFGGVRKDIFARALKVPAPDYMLHEPSWYGFGDTLYAYDIGTHRWLPLEKGEKFARAGAAAMITDDGTLLTVCGELKPGIRTAAVEITPLRNLLSDQELSSAHGIQE